jgi:molybdopterin molybdotransferase
MKKKQDMFVSFESAYETILSSISPLPSEKIFLKESRGRILFEDIISNENVPPCDNSAMDGFGLTADKTTGATTETPKHFAIIGEIQAGGSLQASINSEVAAIRIMTGAPIPAGVDAVVPIENVKEDAAQGIISIFSEIEKNDNIRFAGEDLKIGQIVLRKGARLSSADVGILSALNRSMVPVFKKPRVAIISTGDEIAEVGDAMRYGQIRNSNAYTLQSEVEKYHGIPCYLGIARDSISMTREKLLLAFEHDIVITTGGVSRGKYDFVQEVLSDIGVSIMFDSIKMKPGKPMIFGKKDNTIVFGLPGNPVSTMVSFIEFVRPALLAMSGALTLKKPEIHAISDTAISKKPGRREYIRGIFSIHEGAVHVISTGSQGSGILRSMSMANCLIVMPEDSPGCRSGDKVTIQLIQHEEIN